MGSDDDRKPRSQSVKRSRSLTGSLKGIFKGSSWAASSASNQTLAPGTPHEVPPAVVKKNSSRLGNIATSKEAELSSSRGAPVQAPRSPLQAPVGRHGIPSLAKLSLLQSAHASDSDRVSRRSSPNEEETSFRAERSSSERGSDDETRSYVAAQDAEQGDSMLIDSVLENGEQPAKGETNANFPPHQSRGRANSCVSNSLRRIGSSSSSSSSSNKAYAAGRTRADTVSASSLPRFSEMESKCILQVDNFKVFESGLHEHCLKVTSLVADSNDGSEGLTKQKSGFSLSGIFKPHKEDNQLDNALSLIPSTTWSLSQRLDRVRNHALESSEGDINEEDEESANGESTDDRTPRIVNPNAAVGPAELTLINTLSEKIQRGLKGKMGKAEGEEKGKKDGPTTFHEQYGKPIGVIGHGAYGVVKICARPVTAKDVSPLPTYTNGKRLFFAVKELRPKATDQIEKFSTRITSEFIIGHSLSRCHKRGDKLAPNILKVLDLLETQNCFAEVMEFCPSGDLYNLLTRKSKNGSALHPLEADCFMKQLLHGVHFMHSRGVAHCDLKPENILFHPNGLLKICDFGTSSVFQTAWEKQVHFQSGTMGSEPYVAPEEFIHGSEYDPRLADCWSCGIVYCTMVLGNYLWKVAVRSKDALYDSFCTEMAERKEFYVLEEMRHVNNELNRLRRIALYQIFQVDPIKRVTIADLLQTAWMRRTRCCVLYKSCDREK
ncbi:hypothetical protein HG536_0B03460 [Torulaspora globosa]|uniref:non-specific serine/threonine protein kinase n=1 Tax=Torulaspora globosa TaxID=48254 RepID=A0A7G3ZD97_9SACH|nr:uncharacterized protein HG536_0B03460 [Torulaspora globosa]QLL31483.1 hypothetical protein HG536_0B03460 [Torulaspora globosa]